MSSKIIILGWLLVGAFAISNPFAQQVLRPAPSRFTESGNFSVGFSIQSSFAAASIILEDSHGNLETHTRVNQGSTDYCRVMTELSLASSRHYAPPYKGMDDYFADRPRRALRESRKMMGLAASYEVGVLGQLLQELRSQLETEFDVQITEAVFASSHLMALYQDDLVDTAEYLKIKYIAPRKQFKPILWETASSYAGYGLGLCEHWKDDKKCVEESLALPDINILSVHYSRNALTAGFVPIQTALSAFEVDENHLENFTLGSDHIKNFDNPDEYWAGVKNTLLFSMRYLPGFEDPKRVMITGDMSHEGRFLEFLKKTIQEHMGTVPPILSDRADTAAARGAAELMRRGGKPWEIGPGL